MTVDVFLYRYFREAERVRAPRVVSAEATVRGCFEGAAAAEEWRTWAIMVFGRCQRNGLTPAHSAVMAAVCLNLGVEHFEVLRHQGRVSTRPMDFAAVGEDGTRQRAAPEADVVTMVSWASVCRTVWGKRTGATDRTARRMWHEGRAIVAAALADMGGAEVADLEEETTKAA